MSNVRDWCSDPSACDGGWFLGSPNGIWDARCAVSVLTVLSGGTAIDFPAMAAVLPYRPRIGTLDAVQFALCRQAMSGGEGHLVTLEALGCLRFCRTSLTGPGNA